MNRLALTFLLCLLPGLAVAQSRQPIAVDRIVAVVNDEAITLHELRDRLATITRQLRSRGTPLPPAEVLEKQILERLIMDRLQMQFAKEVGLRPADTELDTALRRIAENNRLSPGEFRAALERDGIAWNRFREEIREEMTLARLREREVDSRIVISDGEIDNYLAHPEQADQTAVVALAHIIVRVPEQATTERLNQLRARAEEALTRVKSGQDFAQIAASYSEAPDAMAGGAIEPRPIDRLPTLYAEAAVKLQPGEVSPILRSPAGFHIVKLLDRKGGSVSGTLRQTHARHILLKVNELVSSNEAKHKLTGLKERLDNGAEFTELARLFSNDLSAAKGGDLGWLYQGDTVPDFERAMDALKPGEISAPVQSPFGWHLIQVLERKNAEPGDERKRLMARQALRERKSDEAYEDWLRQLRDRAYVDFRLEER